MHLLTDPTIIGSVAWLSLVATIGGLGIAIHQILRTRKAAEAAADASRTTRRALFTRERLLELRDALSLVETAQNRLARREYEAALLCLDLGQKDCEQVAALLRPRSRGKRAVAGAIKRIGALSEAILRDVDHADDGNAISYSTEARSIAEVLRAEAARLRYIFEPEDMGDEGR